MIMTMTKRRRRRRKSEKVREKRMNVMIGTRN
jgi:hypothetical protein